MKTVLIGALILTAGLAQETRRVVISKTGELQDQVFTYVGSEMAFDGAVVKGAPYSAEALTETTQTLADGNRIHRTTKSMLYRDSLGRTRREQTLGDIGPLMAAGEPMQTVVINDPVAGTTYMMNSREKIMHKLPNKGEMTARVEAELKTKAEELHRTGTAMTYSVRINHGGREGERKEEERKNIKTESLGTQMMEGVAADGTRTTLTIPAGQIGNEQPILVVTERWYSPQLQTTVLTRTTDPRMGETVYKLSNVKLEEPAPSLFTPPSDYSERE
jgi:hypothetical protein